MSEPNSAMGPSAAQAPAATVSVIIPTHNRAALLADAVRSAWDASIDGMEVIVVDDASTDGTPALVCELRAEVLPGHSLVYLQQARGGAARARNLGLKHARGRFIQFLDSDDILLPGKLATQVAMLDSAQNAEAVVCYTLGVAGPFRNPEEARVGRSVGMCAETPQTLIFLLVGQHAHVMCTAAPLWRSAFLRLQPAWDPDIGIGDDLEYHSRLISAAPALRCVPERLFAVREHSGARLGADALDADRVASLIRTRQSVQRTLVTRGLWTGTQREFLAAMRTLYVNALQFGRPEDVAGLEAWLAQIARPALRFPSIRGTIVCRKVLGSAFVLSSIKLLRSAPLLGLSRLNQLKS